MDIKKSAEEILYLKERDFEGVSELLNYVQYRANDIWALADDAYQSGNKMEDRLREYRDAIESLGFTRSK
jgi:hypothetical protein